MEMLSGDKITKIVGSCSGERDDGDEIGGITLRQTPVWVPLDATREVLLRLPAKSLMRFLCVSKLWGSTIRDPDFVKSFITQSSTRLCLFFSIVCPKSQGIVIFSCPYPQNPDDESPCVANPVVTLPEYHPYTVINSVRGLVCLGAYPEFIVCNPSTRSSMVLPKIESKLECKSGFGYFGYDPIGDQYKMLWVMSPKDFVVDGIRGLDQEIRVIALGDQEWRRIECSCLHYPVDNGVCMNGVVYYKGYWRVNGSMKDSIVSFDVRSEKFDRITIPDGYMNANLMNFAGRLALSYVDETRNIVVVYFLEAAGKEEGLRLIYDLPVPLGDLVGNTELRFDDTPWRLDVYATRGGELVLAPHWLFHPYYLLFFDPRSNSLRKVEIQGIAPHDLKLGDRQPKFWRYVWKLTDHVESTMLL